MKVESLSLDLQRKEDDSSDLKEKLSDYKKQIQQIQKEVHDSSVYLHVEVSSCTNQCLPDRCFMCKTFPSSSF